MKTLFQIVRVIILTTLSLSVSAQDDSENSKIPTDEMIFMQQILNTDYTLIQTDQILNSDIYFGNVALIIQTGNGNDATIFQYGDYNFGGITQTGDYNDAELDIRGDRNFAVIEQYGSFNYAEKSLTGDNNWFQLEQTGNGLQFTIEGTLPAGTIITQEGNGMQIEIK